MDYVVTKREQWRKLKESATNPPPSSSLLSAQELPKESVTDARTTESSTEKSLSQEKTGQADEKEKREESKESDSSNGEKEDKGNEEQLITSESSIDSEMEKMLSELTSIVPPKTLPPTDSITSQDTNRSSEDHAHPEENEGVLDSLAIMRKRLEESMQEADEASPSKGSNRKLKIELNKPGSPGSASDERAEEEDDDEEDFEVIDTTIRVLPPTPTVTREAVGNGDLMMTSFPVDPMNSLVVGTSHDVVGFQGKSLSGMDEEKTTEKDSGKKKEDVVDQGPFFTPSILQNSDKKVRTVCVCVCAHMHVFMSESNGLIIIQ